MERYEYYVDLTDINDSMELNSNQEIASYEKDGFVVTLEVRGAVRVVYKNNVYKDASQMPEELIRIFHDGKVLDNEDLYVDDNNWFETFFWERNGNSLEWTRLSDVVDAENSSPEDIREFLKDCFNEYRINYERPDDSPEMSPEEYELQCASNRAEEEYFNR